MMKRHILVFCTLIAMGSGLWGGRPGYTIRIENNHDTELRLKTSTKNPDGTHSDISEEREISRKTIDDSYSVKNAHNCLRVYFPASPNDPVCEMPINSGVRVITLSTPVPTGSGGSLLNISRQYSLRYQLGQFFTGFFQGLFLQVDPFKSREVQDIANCPRDIISPEADRLRVKGRILGLSTCSLVTAGLLRGSYKLWKWARGPHTKTN